MQGDIVLAHNFSLMCDVVEATRDLINDIKQNNPEDFKEGGKGWQCPHMKKMDDALTRFFKLKQ